MIDQQDSYKALAVRLDSLPNSFPPTDDGSEIRLLAKLFTQDEAELASKLKLTLETAEQISERLGIEYTQTRKLLKDMAGKGLIHAGKAEGGLGYGLLPFVVGIYENQVGEMMDVELATLFEEYYQSSFSRVLSVKPSVHRVIPVGENIKNNMQVAPYESAAGIVERAQSWGVLDCICRKQTALIGKPCKHTVRNCMAFSVKPNAFQTNEILTSISKEEAYKVLRHAEEEGLVHTVSNSQDGTSYICNCCTCSCGILRGMAELGIANVVASSAFVNTVDETLCTACALCVESCQFDALSVVETAIVNRNRCVGCGVCVPACPDDALILVRRPDEEIKPVPVSLDEWGMQRAEQRGIDLNSLL